MALFGWCLSDMDIAQHAKCIEEFDFGTPIVCQCLCHTDYVAFEKTKTTPPTKKGKKK